MELLGRRPWIAVVILAILIALMAPACGPSKRPTRYVSSPAQIVTVVETAEVGPFVEGRIVEHHYAFHPEWGMSRRSSEPLVSRGRWETSPQTKTPIWVPFWVRDFYFVNQCLSEVDALPGNLVERYRVVACSPGSFSYDVDGRQDGTNLARGIWVADAWHVPADSPEFRGDEYEDVIFVAWRFQPYESNFPLLRALSHEVLDHQLNRDFTHEVEGVSGPCVLCLQEP